MLPFATTATDVYPECEEYLSTVFGLFWPFTLLNRCTFMR